MRTQTSSLPQPARERWQPLRSGFVNLYKYDREEFRYENGRLLLRGNNGTGKSRVLALQLPFLLDGEVNPERLEPDADPSKKIEWNLLMGRYPDRTGYTWIEFGRRENNGGNAHYLTLGCGLRAVEGQAGVRQWFFITSQRIGKDLELCSDSNQVFGKDLLRGKIGAAGRVFDNAEAYRSAVNDALFQLDEYRYASLMNLLIQLRRPQLTRRLEEHELSRALSEALPPVSPAIVANVAEAFRELESDRSQLNSSRFALAAVENFLAGYRSYAKAAAKRRADRVLTTHDEYEISMKEILTAEAECDRSLAELARLKADLQRLAVEEHALIAEIEAFQRSSDGTNAVLSLEQTQQEAAEKRRESERAASELSDAALARKSCIEEHLRVRDLMEHHRRRWVAVMKEASAAAATAGLEVVHRNCIGAIEIENTDNADWKQARKTVASAIQALLEKTDQVRALRERTESAKGEFQRAGASRDQLFGLLDEACERLTTGRAEHEASITSFLGAASDWTAGLTELPLPFDEAFLRSVSEWCDRPHGPNPFAVAAGKAVEELNVNFSETRADLKQLEKTLTCELNTLESEQERLASSASAESARRLEELDAAIVEAQGRLDPVIDSISELNRREGILRSEARAVPSDESVRQAYDYAVALSRHADSLRNRVDEAEEHVTRKRLHFDQIRAHRDRAFAELGLAQSVDDLPALQDGIAQYRLAIAAFWTSLESYQEARTACDWAWSQVEQATNREARQKEIAEHLAERAGAAEIASDAAGKTVDTDTGKLLERVARARARLEALRIEEKDLRRRYHDTEISVTRVDECLRSRTMVLTGETDRRDNAASALRSFASTGLLKLAVPGLDGKSGNGGKDAATWSTTRTVEMAFELSSRLNSIDAGDTAWEYHQKSVPSQFTTLMQALSAEGCKSSAAFCDDVFVATAVFAGEERAMDELRKILVDDVAPRQMLLDAQAREILENQLVGAVSSHLRELLLAAEEHVRQMNIELESRPMSTGLKLRFAWRPAEFAPSGMADARQRLMQSNDAWTSAERQMLGKFLQQQVEAVFSEIENASWQDSLAEALDYRKWHWFGVERFQDGVWKRLTQRTYGTGSGGEKAVALTLPHFAAAAGFYRTAHALAPRLILLDEAFVGIDADMRAKCMGLIHVFDLDFMMTSEREWGCYPTLPGMAIYQLSTRPDIDAIGLTRWVWNGNQRSLGEGAKKAEAVRTIQSSSAVPDKGAVIVNIEP